MGCASSKTKNSGGNSVATTKSGASSVPAYNDAAKGGRVGGDASSQGDGQTVRKGYDNPFSAEEEGRGESQFGDLSRPQGFSRRRSRAGEKYRLAGPSCPGEAISCFKNGLLYRVVDGNTWYFYNDSQEYEMHVQVRFGSRSALAPLGLTNMETEPDGGLLLTVVVYPGETEPFMEGKYDGFKCNMSAKPLSLEYRERVMRQVGVRVAEAIENFTDNVGRITDDEEALDAALRKGCQFVDLSFPPVQSSLSREGVDTRRIPLTPWMRPTEYLPPEMHGKIAIFRGIDPNDIDQGQLGDCWLMCAIASVAEFPGRVRRLFAHPFDERRRPAENALGAYRVSLNIDGWWRSVVVDDYFPALAGKPVFAKNLEDLAELWVSLLEKAFAKKHGSYAAITGGDALLALQDLTGFPTNRFDSDWEEARRGGEKSAELFKRLVAFDEENFLVTINTPGYDTSSYTSGNSNPKEMEAMYRKLGLGLGHAYSVLVSRYFPKKNLRLCKIRNPWGSAEEWTGAWSDKSVEWKQNPDIARDVQQEVAEDGTFWMEWEDVKRYFDGGGVCFTRPEWYDYRVKGSFNGLVPSVAVEVKVTRPVTVFLVLSQSDKRGQSPSSVDYKYAAIMISVSRNEKDKQCIHLNSSTDALNPTDKYTFSFARDHAMAYTFEPEYSPYLIIPRIYEPASKEKQFVLGILTDQNVEDRAMSCTFKQLRASCKVFDNFPKFLYDSSTTEPSEAEFQCSHKALPPQNMVGTFLRSISAK